MWTLGKGLAYPTQLKIRPFLVKPLGLRGSRVIGKQQRTRQD
jgi:hypothetical protein